MVRDLGGKRHHVDLPLPPFLNPQTTTQLPFNFRLRRIVHVVRVKNVWMDILRTVWLSSVFSRGITAQWIGYLLYGFDCLVPCSMQRAQASLYTCGKETCPKAPFSEDSTSISILCMGNRFRNCLLCLRNLRNHFLVYLPLGLKDHFSPLLSHLLAAYFEACVR